MSNDVKSFLNGDTVTASEFNQRAIDIEDFVNGGIERTDLHTGEWVDTKMVRPQKFFGSPAPRSEGVSGDIHHRQTFRANAQQHFLWRSIAEETYEPIVGLAQTVHVVPKRPGQAVAANCMVSFYAREVNDGNADYASWGTGTSGDFPEQYTFATFGLFVQKGNGPVYFQPGTYRKLYVSGQERTAGYANRYGAKNISIIARLELDHGINNVYVGASIRTPTANKEGWRLHVAHRTMVLDIKHI